MARFDVAGRHDAAAAAATGEPASLVAGANASVEHAAVKAINAVMRAARVMPRTCTMIRPRYCRAHVFENWLHCHGSLILTS